MFLSPIFKNDPFNDFRREVDRLFEDWASPAWTTDRMAWAPLADVEEENDHYMITLEVPGMKRDELRIELMENQLIVSGERRYEKAKEGSRYSERRYGRFHRSFTLPSSVDSDKVEAQYEDGVLKIYVPKTESAKRRVIKIGTSGGIFDRLLGRRDEKTIEHKKEDVA